MAPPFPASRRDLLHRLRLSGLPPLVGDAQRNSLQVTGCSAVVGGSFAAAGRVELRAPVPGWEACVGGHDRFRSHREPFPGNGPGHHQRWRFALEPGQRAQPGISWSRTMGPEAPEVYDDAPVELARARRGVSLIVISLLVIGLDGL